MNTKDRKITQTAAQTAENKITEGVIWKQLLLFFFPILFGTLFQQLYNAADAVIVGRFVGKEALSAVGGGTGTVINLLVGFFVGLSGGASVVISQYYGARKAELVEYAVHTAIAFCILGGKLLEQGGLERAHGHGKRLSRQLARAALRKRILLRRSAGAPPFTEQTHSDQLPSTLRPMRMHRPSTFVSQAHCRTARRQSGRRAPHSMVILRRSPVAVGTVTLL